MSPSLLSSNALAKVTSQVEKFGSSLKGDHKEAIGALLETLGRGLNGELEPAYYLSAIDPGVGKSLAIAAFLSAWKEAGFLPRSSVLIGLSRLEEIKSFLSSSGLSKDDVAVLTGKPELNELGCTQERHGAAPVMFTTQQMIERRTRGRPFAEAAEFHFRGCPRNLRIWDESLVPAEPLALRVDDLARLPAALRYRHPEYAKLVQALAVELWTADEGARVQVPEGLAEAAQVRLMTRDQHVTEALDTLSRLAGRDVDVIFKANGDIHLSGASSPIPQDFAPVVILDASGRVRSTYRLWEKSGGPLRRLPVAVNDYSRLRVHLWERKVGKVALQSPGNLEDLVKAIADVIHDDAANDWLIVSYKDAPVEEMLIKAVSSDAVSSLHFLTWGMHHGTNAYSHCRKIVLIGQLTYGASGYRSLAAACGCPDADETTELELKRGEYSHNILQALTRASVRRNDDGKAAMCTAYVIASPNVGMAELLPEVFPGCTVERWAPNVPEVGGRAGQLIAFFEDAKARRVGSVTKKELCEALNLQGPNLTRLLKHPDVLRHMEHRGYFNERSVIIVPPAFEPYPGGGFTIDQLEDLD